MDVAQLLCELIALPSVNPALAPADHPSAGEGLVADYLTSLAAQAGLDIDRQEVFPGRNNLLARLAPTGRPRHRILLAPHLDTVAAPEHQFTPRRQNGRVYGRGACDTKGSLAAMFAALAELTSQGQRPSQTELVLVGLVDEENAQSGSRALARAGYRADLAIVGEPTRLQVVTAHKGDLWLQLETHGKAAHGATPHRGRNAVHTMARVVDLLETTYAAALRKRRHPLLGCATISVGSIRGGTQANIVPDRCVMSADRRTLPGESEATVGREIQSLLRRHKLRAQIADTKAAPCRPMETDVRLPLVQAFMDAIGQRQPAGVDFFCDASVLAEAGIPSVVFGPGDIAQAHTADEWISLASLERAKRLFGRFFARLP